MRICLRFVSENAYQSGVIRCPTSKAASFWCADGQRKRLPHPRCADEPVVVSGASVSTRTVELQETYHEALTEGRLGCGTVAAVSATGACPTFVRFAGHNHFSEVCCASGSTRLERKLGGKSARIAMPTIAFAMSVRVPATILPCPIRSSTCAGERMSTSNGSPASTCRSSVAALSNRVISFADGFDNHPDQTQRRMRMPL